MTTVADPPFELGSRQVVATALAAALSDPRTDRAHVPAWLTADLLEPSWQIVRAAIDSLPAMALAPGERNPRELDAVHLSAWLALPVGRREAVHQAIFGVLAPRDCPPFETEYLRSNDSAHRAQALADIAGFYRALGLAPPDLPPARHDHAALELEFLAFAYQLMTLAATAPPEDAEAIDRLRSLARSFFQDHVAWWMPAFGRCLERRVASLTAADPPLPLEDLAAFAGVARFLAGWIACERHWHGIAPPSDAARPRAPESPEDDSCGAGCATTAGQPPCTG